MSGTNILTMQPEHQLRDLYNRLPPEHRTWRCEQAKKSQDLLEQSWVGTYFNRETPLLNSGTGSSVLNVKTLSWQKLLEPCTKGVWERDEVYKGIALFIKSTYEGQVRQRMSCSSGRSHMIQTWPQHLAGLERWSGIDG